MSTRTDYYELLGIPRDAITEEIRRAYHEAALKMHPDVSSHPNSKDGFLEIQQAYDTLIHPHRRKQYDHSLKTENSEPLSIEMLYSHANLVRIAGPQLIYTLMDFSALECYKNTGRPEINISLVIDRSTSMQGKRLDTVKTAVIKLLRRLRPEDLFSITIFSDRAEVLLSAARNKELKKAETLIQMIRAEGGTEIFQGLKAGFEEVSKHIHHSLVNHIILLTDGRTYGDEENCLSLANEAAEKGARITSLGIGSKWNDVFLDEMAERTGGTSHYIHRMSDINNFIQDTFERLSETYAENVTLQLTPEKGVDIRSVFRLQPEPTNYSAHERIQIGSILNSSKTSLLLEMAVNQFPEAALRRQLARGRLDFVLASSPTEKTSLPVNLSRLIGNESAPNQPPERIVKALALIQLYRMQERARQEVNEGKIQEATQRLRHLATQLIALGEHDLAETVIMEAEHIQKSQTLSADGEKIIKYGTRSLLLPSKIKN